MSPPCYTLDELLALKRACPPGKHWGVVILLLMLAEERGEPVEMSRIAEKMLFSAAAATDLVDAAEQLGLVARYRAAGDRRKVCVRLAARGLALVGALNSQATAAA